MNGKRNVILLVQLAAKICLGNCAQNTKEMCKIGDFIKTVLKQTRKSPL